MHSVIYNRGNLRRLNCEAAQVICMTWKTAPLLKILAVFSFFVELICHNKHNNKKDGCGAKCASRHDQN